MLDGLSDRKADTMIENEALLSSINPWWKDGKVSRELAKPYRREAFLDAKKLMGYRQAVMLTGLRRVGKSTIMFQLIEELLKSVSRERLLYFTFDLGKGSVMGILDAYSSLTSVDWKREKVFLFLDEVQKLPGWQDEVKIIYDNFPCIKMVLSGSSSLWLEKDAIKALAGRHFSVDVKPLGFGEFLSLKGKAEYAEKPALWERELRREFALYLKRPFPETAAWDNEILLRKYVREMVLDKVLRSDLPEKFTDANPGILMRLVETFYSQPGMSVNYERLAADMKISKATLASHVFYLELAYLIRRVRNFRSRQATASRKMQKIYPYHWGLVYSVGEPEVSESFVASIIDAKYYWREGKREIDFVHNGKDILPIEVKSGGVKSGDLDSIAHFCGRRRLHRAMVVYNGAEKSGKAGDTEIRFLPFWKFALSPARLL